MSEAGRLAGVREAVAVFSSGAELQGAIDDLLLAHFDRSELSLLASEEAVREKLSGRYYKITEIEDDVEVPHAAYVAPEDRGSGEGAVIGALVYVGAGVLMGPVAAAGGGIAAILGAAAIGGGVGGAIGAVLAAVMDARHVDDIKRHLDHGGLLLWVRVWDQAREREAVDVLKRHGGRDIHVHEFPAPG